MCELSDSFNASSAAQPVICHSEDCGGATEGNIERKVDALVPRCPDKLTQLWQILFTTEHVWARTLGL